MRPQPKGTIMRIFASGGPARMKVLLASMLAVSLSIAPATASGAGAKQHGEVWIGTWATAAQPPLPGDAQSFRNQTLRLIVHTSAGGTKARIKISNTYGDQPLFIGAA